MPEAPTVVLISYHYAKSKRRGGFHALADSYRRLGWNVVFVTAPISRISRLRRDHRLGYDTLRERNRLIQIDDRYWSYVLYSLIHPVDFRNRLLNRLGGWLLFAYRHVRFGALEDVLKAADLIIVESTAALVLVDRLRELNPSARLVYRVSDDLRTVNAPPALHDRELALAEKFDIVSTLNSTFQARFQHLGTAELQPHGIDRDVFDRPSVSPYVPGTLNAIFVGVSLLDEEFLKIASELRPEWSFHVIGPVSGPQAQNITYYGEMPFRETVPFIVHADAGLQTRRWTVGAETLSDSLKVQQYTYCRLPIIAPTFLRSDRPNLFCYEPGDPDSIARALDASRAFDGRAELQQLVSSWMEVAQRLAPPSKAQAPAPDSYGQKAEATRR
ncbi:MAG: glucuronosyltransferase [Actinomycetota bacterium]|nr:glucuronosyltransferase [Actinomycetota bacterium]